MNVTLLMGRYSQRSATAEVAVHPARRCVAAAIRLALHALRDSLGYDAAVNVGVRLRPPFRQLYYETWPAAVSARLATRQEFVQRIGGPDDPDGPGEFLARVALLRVSQATPYPARVEIRKLLPPHLRPFWPVVPRSRRRHYRQPSPVGTHLRLVSESRRAS